MLLVNCIEWQCRLSHQEGIVLFGGEVGLVGWHCECRAALLLGILMLGILKEAVVVYGSKYLLVCRLEMWLWSRLKGWNLNVFVIALFLAHRAVLGFFILECWLFPAHSWLLHKWVLHCAILIVCFALARKVAVGISLIDAVVKKDGICTDVSLSPVIIHRSSTWWIIVTVLALLIRHYRVSFKLFHIWFKHQFHALVLIKLERNISRRSLWFSLYTFLYHRIFCLLLCDLLVNVGLTNLSVIWIFYLTFDYLAAH